MLPALPPPTATNHIDPRILNPYFQKLLTRELLLFRLQTVSRHWRQWCHEIQRRGPRLVLNYHELSRMAGGRWGDGKGKQRAGQWKGKVWEATGEAETVPEVVCWMSPLPGEEVPDDGEVGEQSVARWPKWYLDDYMRHDLGRTQVQALRILAASAGESFHPAPTRSSTPLTSTRKKPSRVSSTQRSRTVPRIPSPLSTWNSTTPLPLQTRLYPFSRYSPASTESTPIETPTPRTYVLASASTFSVRSTSATSPSAATCYVTRRTCCRPYGLFPTPG